MLIRTHYFGIEFGQGMPIRFNLLSIKVWKNNFSYYWIRKVNSIYLFHIWGKVESWNLTRINKCTPLYIDEKWSVEDDHHVRAKIQFAAMQLLKRSLDGVFQILLQFEIFYEELYHAQPIVALKSVNWNRQSFSASLAR